MRKYSVTVDYITTATIIVEAQDESMAEAIVEEQFDILSGINRLLSRMQRNYPDGFSIEGIEEADGEAEVDIAMVAEWSD